MDRSAGQRRRLRCRVEMRTDAWPTAGEVRILDLRASHAAHRQRATGSRSVEERRWRVRSEQTPIRRRTIGRQPDHRCQTRTRRRAHACRRDSSAMPVSASMIADGAAPRSTRLSRVSTSVASAPVGHEDEERPAAEVDPRIPFETKARRRRRTRHRCAPTAWWNRRVPTARATRSAFARHGSRERLPRRRRWHRENGVPGPDGSVTSAVAAGNGQ